MSDYEYSDPEDDTFYDEDEEMHAQDEGKWSVFGTILYAITRRRLLSL